MDEYLDLIQIFFDEKLMFLTEEKQHSCPDCTDKKKFIEKSAPVDIEGGRGEIILSCGDTKSDKSKCGNKIRIILPIYSSNKDLNFLKNKLNKMINWDIISEFIDVDPKLIQDNKDITEKYNEELKKLKELFNKYNNDNFKKINKNYEEIIELKSLQKTKLSELKNPENKSKVKELKKDYIVISEKITLLFREIKELDIQDYYLTTDPEIAVQNLDFRDSSKNKKKPAAKDKPVKDAPKDKPGKTIKDEIKEGSNVSWTKDGKDFNGVVEKITDKSYKICCKPDGKKYRVPKELVNLNNLSEDKLQGPDKLKGPDKSNNIYYFSNSAKVKQISWLSTFNKDNPFKYNGYIYPTVEHAFHSQKISNDDPKKDEYIKLFTNPDLPPNVAKTLGSKVNFEKENYKFRNDWDKNKLRIMEEINLEYYKSNDKFLKKLKETGNKNLIHKGFRIDPFWGVRGDNDEGENHHGKILMKIREKL